MNTNKSYKLANKKKAQVTYGFTGGKWNFKIGNFTLMTKVPDGKENADRIADILRKSFLRCNEVDGTARLAINRIVSSEFKSLKDYRGAFDHNFSWTDNKNQTEGPVAVEMVPPARPVVEVVPLVELVGA